MSSQKIIGMRYIPVFLPEFAQVFAFIWKKATWKKLIFSGILFCTFKSRSKLNWY